MTLTGPDVSRYQGLPDFGAVKRAGHNFAVVKASEGVGYVSPVFAGQRMSAHAANLIVGLYHFARAGDPVAEANFFLRTVGTLYPGEFVVLDWEVPAANPPGWCLAWLNAVHAATRVKPLVYMNSSAVNGSNWSPVVAADYGLWLARYDGTQTQPSVPYWGAPALKQFTDAASVPGISGGCDLNVFFGSWDQLLAYGAPQPPPPPTPTPTPEADVQLTDPITWTDPATGQEQTFTVAEWVSWGNIWAQRALAAANAAKTDVDALAAKVSQPPQLDPAVVTGWLDANKDAIAQKVADAVIAGLGQRINTPPPA